MKFRNGSRDPDALREIDRDVVETVASLNDSAALIICNSAALPHKISCALSNTRMKTVEEIRRSRLSGLKERFGTMAALNEKLGRTKTDSTLTQYLNESKGSKTNKPKQMGSPMARSIEAKLGLEEGWMDNDPELVAAAGGAQAEWPFDGLDAHKVAALDNKSLLRLEGAILLAAGQLGIDLAKPPDSQCQPQDLANQKRA